MTVTFGLIYSYSEFFIPFHNQFGWDHTVDSTIPAVAIVIFSVGCPIAAYLISRFGTRSVSVAGGLLVGSGAILSSAINSYLQLLVLFGVVVAFGAAIAVLLSNTLSVRWFVKRRGIAVGIAASGSGIGTLVVPPLAGYLILSMGWRSTLLILGAAFLVILLIASYFMQTPEDRATTPYGWENLSTSERSEYRNYTLRQAVSSASFWMLFSMFFLGTFAMTMFVVHSVPLAASEGIGVLSASLALGLFGAGSLFARVVIGALSDQLGGAKGLIVAFSIELVGMALVVFVNGNALLLYLASFSIGFGFGGFLADLVGLTGDVFGTKHIEKIWGWITIGYGLGGLLGPVFGGAYFDRYGSYVGAFGVGAGVAAGAPLIATYFAIRVQSKIPNALR